jgi:small subunit ribosomal protein S17
MPKRILQGLVVSNSCEKSIVVLVTKRVMHPLYKKFIKRSNKFMAHDPNNIFKVGDKVRIQECRPLSKRKTWQVIN